MAKKSRDKGATFEREIANALTEQLGFEVRRNSAMYADTPDIKVGKWIVECKRRSKIGLIYEAIEQAQGYCHEPNATPMVIVRADGKKALAIIELDTAINVIRESFDV